MRGLPNEHPGGVDELVKRSFFRILYQADGGIIRAGIVGLLIFDWAAMWPHIDVSGYSWGWGLRHSSPPPPPADRSVIRVPLVGTGKEWDEAYEYLAAGNTQLLEQLYARFARGPIKWNSWIYC